MAISKPAGERLCLRPALLRAGHRIALHRDGGKAYPRMLEAIRGARQSVLLEMSLFADDATGRVFADVLAGCAEAGLDVRLLVPGRTDFAPVLYGMQRLFTSHLLAGIRIFEWSGPMMHAKTMVVDGTWSTVGSYNIDRLSGFHKYELIAVVCDANFGRRMKDMMEVDFARSREIKRKAWRNRGWRRRLLERFS